VALIWTEGAIADLEHIRRYLGAIGRGAETRLAWAAIDTARRLDAYADHPAGCHDVALLRPFVLRVHGAGPTGFVLSVRQRGGAIR
jgi:plasmid stabilization system protein ParE